MLGINRRPEPAETRSPAKPSLAPPLTPTSSLTPAPSSASAAAPPANADQPLSPTARGAPAPRIPEATADRPPSTLSVGVDIKLKGVEISNCDALVVEGDVEATITSKALEIAQPGTLTGTATIDVAEIHGCFSGELTARTRLVVHGTGRVSGTIRYGKLIVAEGGEVNGDVRQIDATARSADVGAPSASRSPAPPPAPLFAREAGGRSPA